MSAAVTPLPGADRARSANLSLLLIATAFAIGIIGGVALASAVAKGPTVPPAPVAAAPAPPIGTAMDSYLAYRAVQSNLATALEQHDARQAAVFRHQLAALADGDVISTGYAEHARLLASLAAAERQHDGRAVGQFRRQLATLCGPGDAALFDFCGAT
jgi:hypothetical protein